VPGGDLSGLCVGPFLSPFTLVFSLLARGVSISSRRNGRPSREASSGRSIIRGVGRAIDARSGSMILDKLLSRKPRAEEDSMASIEDILM
jgi:hypothetical protein